MSLTTRLLGLLTLSWTTICEAQATIELVSPPSFQQGAVTRITITGTELSQVVGLWTSLPPDLVHGKLVNGGTGSTAQLDVTVANNSPLGIFGLRVATTAGLSNVHLFAIDDLPPVAAETLPVVDGRRPVVLPAAVWGTFREAHVDHFSIQVQADERVAFETVAGRLGKDADPILTIFDAQRRRIVQSDNSIGLLFDSRFEHTFTEAGAYTVELSDTRYQGADHWGYVLRMGHFPAVQVAIPSTVRPGEATILALPELPGLAPECAVPVDARRGAFFHAIRRPSDDASSWVQLSVSELPNSIEAEPNDQPEQATPITVPGHAHGCLLQPGDRDWFVFDLSKGQKLDVRAETRTIGSAADVELVLTGPKGNELKRVDDVGLDEANFSFVAPTEGPYRLLVRELTGDGGAAFTYRIEIRAGGPQFQLVSAVADLTVPQNGYQALPINVTRTEYPGPIELSLAGAPAGVTLEPNTLADRVSEVCCLLRVPESVATGLYTLQVVGRAQVNETPISAVAKTQPMIDRQLVNVDLIRYALRENQRLLPPSLTETISLQVTPPAPFTFEILESPVTLARYQGADIPIATTRSVELTGPIVFSARGGPVGAKSQLRIQVYAEIPNATDQHPNVTGRIFARNLAQVAKSRIDVDAMAEFQGRKITLSRALQLDLKTAFEVTPDPAQVALEPGQTTRIKLNVQRLKTFAGSVTVTPSPVNGLELPETIVIPANQTSGELELCVPADMKPTRLNIRLTSNGLVEKFQEETQGQNLQVEIKAPPKK